MSSKPGSVYKSLETDREFQERLWNTKGVSLYYDFGEHLDRLAWTICKTQRRIVERTA